MIVVKFGGTSLAGTDRMRAAARIVAAHRRDHSVVCVVSAIAGVTDHLIRVVDLATRGIAAWKETLAQVSTTHQQTLAGLTTTGSAVPTTTPRLAAMWTALEADLARIVETAYPTEEARAHAVAAFSAWGERLSVLLFSEALANEGITAAPFEGEPVVMVERLGPAESTPDAAHPTGANVPWEWLAPSVAATRSMLADQLSASLRAGLVPVLPGYIARTTGGLVTTLGRNGSDHSAAIIAAALGARDLYLYSDVAGVHRADPHLVPGAELLPALTYADAAEIAALGARVLHPATLRPLAAAGIPLRLRQTLSPESPGTNIGPSNLLRTGTPNRGAWVVTARPLTPDRPLFGTPEDWQPGLVEVTGLFLSHSDLVAREDDHLAPEFVPIATRTATGQPGDGPVSCAFALLASSPRPLGLALSARRISVAVPAAESSACQHRLYTALTHADARGAHATGAPRIYNLSQTARLEWRRTS